MAKNKLGRATRGDFIPARIAGIPCQVLVTHFHHQPPMGPSADSDWDCYGYTEVDFDVYDLKGYPAEWLERKMSDCDRERIEEECAAVHRAAMEEYDGE